MNPNRIEILLDPYHFQPEIVYYRFFGEIYDPFDDSKFAMPPSLDDEDGFLEFDDFKKLKFIRFLINRTRIALKKQTTLFPPNCGFEIISFISESINEIELDLFWKRLGEIINIKPNIFGFKVDFPKQDDPVDLSYLLVGYSENQLNEYPSSFVKQYFPNFRLKIND